MLERCFLTGGRCGCLEELEKKYNPKSVFLVMSYKYNRNIDYEDTIKAFFQQMDYDFDVVLAKDEFTNEEICHKICRELQTCGFGIVLLSDPRPNVIFEMGFLYGLGKEVILIADKKEIFHDLDKLPSDIIPHVSYYACDTTRELKETLAKIMRDTPIVKNAEERMRALELSKPLKEFGKKMDKIKISPEIAPITQKPQKIPKHLEIENLVDIISKTKGSVELSPYYYLSVGNFYFNKWEFDKAETTYQMILGKLPEFAPAIASLALIHYRRNEWNKAIEVFENSLELFEKYEDEYGKASTYNNIGSIYADKGEWDKALEYYGKASTAFEKLGDEQGKASTYNNMGLIYARKGEWDKALEYYNKDLAISEKLGDEQGKASSWLNEAFVFAKTEKYDKALELCNKSYEIYSRLSDKPNIAECFRVYGIIYGGQKIWEKSEENFKKSIDGYEELDSKYEIAETYFEYGLMLKSKGDKKEAKEKLTKALEIFESLKVEYKVKKIEKELEEL